ncbi:MAG: hypothetical protein ACRD1W_13970, partial [Vicinamibacterales bacterium]
FYSLLAASLFVPVLGAMWVPRATARDAMASIAGGVGMLLAFHFGTDGKGWNDPGLWGLIGSAVAFGISRLVLRQRVVENKSNRAPEPDVEAS